MADLWPFVGGTEGDEVDAWATARFVAMTMSDAESRDRQVDGQVLASHDLSKELIDGSDVTVATSAKPALPLA